MITTYKGIDYGLGKTNRNLENGIRFGVISQNEVLQAWADSSEPVYTYYCPHCGNGPLKKGQDAKRCPDCYKKIEESDWDFMEPDCFLLDDGEYKAETDDYMDIFITKSPYFTYSQLCSPCAPGAGYITNELEDKDYNQRTYCFGHDWFDSGKAPYTVYSVATGEVVEPTV